MTRTRIDELTMAQVRELNGLLARMPSDIGKITTSCDETVIEAYIGTQGDLRIRTHDDCKGTVSTEEFVSKVKGMSIIP